MVNRVKCAYDVIMKHTTLCLPHQGFCGAHVLTSRILAEGALCTFSRYLVTGSRKSELGPRAVAPSSQFHKDVNRFLDTLGPTIHDPPSEAYRQPLTTQLKRNVICQEPLWKFNLRKCVDASPLVIVWPNTSEGGMESTHECRVVIASHAGSC